MAEVAHTEHCHDEEDDVAIADFWAESPQTAPVVQALRLDLADDVGAIDAIGCQTNAV